ncbi:type II toxin-antitoxin system RelE family toxin [Candidatus Methanocrinis natronophilus]|uniref:Type II toxin-antitoxin system RelE/ParE family toxin n=1 Tax=Candidatus Methanocrinis natronophilus TaxID=3033396 RepID=A0ABT5XAF6_9EURY|nr:hypothetical protein [Candidatus Methanocrinis natronophilus]MDF0591674.1 hypothetical protein [Candidatus Methanocrinis natronophilus]
MVGNRYEIMINEGPRKTLENIHDKDEKTAKIISDHIVKLEDDPYTPRSGTDIDHIEASNPKKYRLRIGAQIRVEYTVNNTDRTVTITKIDPTKRRKSDYKK